MIDGAKVYELEGVEVTAADPRRPKSTAFGAVFDTTILSKFNPISLYNYISFLPTALYFEKKLWLSSRDGPGYVQAQLNINGRIIKEEFLFYYLQKYIVNDVEYIHLVRDSDWRTKSARKDDEGINLPNYPYRIDIYLKPGREFGAPDVQTCQVVGYSENMEFYHPVYDTPEKVNNGKPDKRTTLYWNPYLKTDPNGNTTIEFYSNDTDQVDYDIDIEGIAPDGTIYKSRQKL